jgi:hypothetical protein
MFSTVFAAGFMVGGKGGMASMHRCFFRGSSVVVMPWSSVTAVITLAVLLQIIEAPVSIAGDSCSSSSDSYADIKVVMS